MPDKRLTYRNIRSTGKTSIWDVFSGDVKLAEIRWYAPWRRYCMYTSQHTIFDRSCLAEVIEFLDEQMRERK
jgi:hypothetical protein